MHAGRPCKGKVRHSQPQNRELWSVLLGLYAEPPPAARWTFSLWLPSQPAQLALAPAAQGPRAGWPWTQTTLKDNPWRSGKKDTGQEMSLAK